MKRVPDWTEEEFDLLTQNNSLSDENLSNRLPRRTPGAVRAVRSGVHEFHQQGDSLLLSNMMKKHLTKSETVFVCAICGERIDVRAG